MGIFNKRRLAEIALSLVLVLSSIAVMACGNKGSQESSPVARGTTPEQIVTASSPRLPTTPAIPDQYSRMYSNLGSTLDRFGDFLDRQGEPKNATVFGAELLPANCNRGEDLLKPGVIAAVKLYLDRLQALGVQGVTIPVHYPLYTPEFPRFAEYRSFYQQVIKEIRSRGMKLDIESHVLFANTVFSSVKWDYSRLTFDQYKTSRRDMINRLLNDLHPDFLNIGAEPDTEATLLDMQDLLDPQKYAGYIDYLLGSLQKGASRVVAGIGSWGNLNYARRLATLPALDGLSLHIYPVIGDCLSKAVQIADLAGANNKFIVFDECWLSKTDVLAANGVASSPETFKRDAYSFWATLDQEFLADMVKFSRLYGVAYFSPFWTGFFFAYLDFSPQMAGWSYSDTAAALAPAQSNNVRNGIFSATGEKYRTLIAQYR